MVHYMATHQATEAPSEAGVLPDLMAELTAMQKIAAALSELGDDEARRRVVRWADRFAPEAPAARVAPEAAVTPAVPAAQSPRRRDATLSIDGLNLFEDDPPDSEKRAAPATGEAPLESMIKSFVDEFQQVAREWQGT